MNLSVCLAAVLAAACGPAPRSGPRRPPAPSPSRIERALERGRDDLLRHVERLTESPPATNPMGRLALPVAAALKAGASTKDPRLAAALERLARVPAARTYGAACALMALDASCRRLRQEAVEQLRPPGAAPPEIRAEMEELAAWLAAAQVRGHGSWTYGKPARGARHDFSNTQFAMLGLEVALAHGIRPPSRTLQAAADCLVRSIVCARQPVAVELVREVPLEELLRRRGKRRLPDAARRFRVSPGGWGYTDARRYRSKRADPYASMTAAGASSLLIAVPALRTCLHATGRGAKAPRRSLETLLAAYAWIAIHFDDFLQPGRNLYYNLYSLEKVGDLGGIQKFGGRDWYAEGAHLLLEKQRRDGSWGSYVSTSLAILFLSRATRISAATSGPVILTGGAASNAGSASDLVYIDALQGFLPARALLAHVGETRNTALLPAAREAVANFPMHSVRTLVPSLLALWAAPDRVTAFARKELSGITGIASPRREAYAAWFEERSHSETVQSVEKKRKANASADGSTAPPAPGSR